mmetsp:Transcript_32579/g.73118  ORF Transcript_32579/g.73118 Transcript_32579/m.73118 type:complete len:230 (-) Transcript_32579:220-909(-)
MRRKWRMSGDTTTTPLYVQKKDTCGPRVSREMVTSPDLRGIGYVLLRNGRKVNFRHPNFWLVYCVQSKRGMFPSLTWMSAAGATLECTPSLPQASLHGIADDSDTSCTGLPKPAKRPLWSLFASGPGTMSGWWHTAVRSKCTFLPERRGSNTSWSCCTGTQSYSFNPAISRIMLKCMEPPQKPCCLTVACTSQALRALEVLHRYRHHTETICTVTWRSLTMRPLKTQSM